MSDITVRAASAKTDAAGSFAVDTFLEDVDASRLANEITGDDTLRDAVLDTIDVRTALRYWGYSDVADILGVEFVKEHFNLIEEGEE